MKTTRHGRWRMKGRGIQEMIVLLVLEMGMPLKDNPDRILLTRRDLRALFEEGLINRRVFAFADRALPVVCVVVDGTLVTVWKPKRSAQDAVPVHLGAASSRSPNPDGEELEEAA